MSHAWTADEIPDLTNGRGNLKGYPTEMDPPPLAMDRDLRARLWHRTESMLGIAFDFARQTA